MAMTLVKKQGEHRIYKRGDNRYAVKNAAGAAVNGDEKVAVLLAAGLVTAPTPKAPAAEPAEEAAEDGAAEAAAEE